MLLFQRQAEPPSRRCVNVFSFASTHVASSPTPAAPYPLLHASVSNCRARIFPFEWTIRWYSYG